MPITCSFKGQRIALHQHPNQYLEIQLNNCEGINKFDQKTLTELNQVIDLINHRPPQGVIITSAQKVFFAGGDIEEFVARFNLDQPDIITALHNFNAVLTRLESLPFPTIAILTGATLGGGVELALACDYRLALPNIKIGLPEVNLGIIPGTGGTVRLSRLIGAQHAAQWISHGKVYSGNQAYQAGLVDTLLTVTNDTLDVSLALLGELTKTEAAATTWQQLRAKKYDHYSILSSIEKKQLQQQIQQQFQDKTQTARLTAIDVIAEQCSLSFEQALNHESQQVAKLGCTQDSRDLVNAFLNKSP